MHIKFAAKSAAVFSLLLGISTSAVASHVWPLKDGFLVSNSNHIWFVGNNGSASLTDLQPILNAASSKRISIIRSMEPLGQMYKSYNGVNWFKVTPVVTPSGRHLPYEPRGFYNLDGRFYLLGSTNSNDYCTSSNGISWSCAPTQKFAEPSFGRGSYTITTGNVAERDGYFIKVYEVSEPAISGSKNVYVMARGSSFRDTTQVVSLNGYTTKSSNAPFLVGNHLVSFKYSFNQNTGQQLDSIGTLNVKTLKFTKINTKPLGIYGSVISNVSGAGKHFVVSGSIDNKKMNPVDIIVDNDRAKLVKAIVPGVSIYFNGKLFLCRAGSEFSSSHKLYISNNGITWRSVK